jgi:hypothetical protein
MPQKVNSFEKICLALCILAVNNVEMTVPGQINIAQVAIRTQLQCFENHITFKKKAPILKAFLKLSY